MVNGIIVIWGLCMEFEYLEVVELVLVWKVYGHDLKIDKNMSYG